MGINVDLRDLRNNFISLLVLRAGNYIIPLLTLPFLVKVLGVEKFGLVAFGEMIVLYFKSVVDYGFDLTGTRSISENREDHKVLDKLINTIFGAKLLLLLVCFLFLVFLILIFPKLNEIKLLLIYSYGIVLGNALLPTWYFQGIEQMKYITIVNLISKISYLLLLFLLVSNESDYIYVPLLNALGLVIGGLVSLYIMKRKFNINFYFPKLEDVFFRLKEDFNIFISTLAPNLYNNSMGVLLGVFTNNIQVGYYSAATKLIEVGNSIINIISTTIFPYLNRNIDYRKKLISLTLIVGFFSSMFFLIFSKTIVVFLFGDEMLSSVFILKILSLNPLFIAVMSAYGINTLILQKRDVLVRNIILFYSIIGFLSGIIFIEKYGIIAAAIILVSIRGLIGLTQFIVVKIKY
ncbi:oligosaccharide flippase family protein [Aestuariibaculum suncheonense]|uniref:Oligosaccharide flippase family protein n=1 Tax=Aestuariibaculum suncheonense TaxID=1028745 RepID=A0A8J6Q9B2_9FLAO|nr:oligosaccharide flippase family protein [Aestuariibaculum suncheonense]MBD0833808.1 oligosaccharide flippase family protein [Aestuariibaculum suncheonense]